MGTAPSMQKKAHQTTDHNATEKADEQHYDNFDHLVATASRKAHLIEHYRIGYDVVNIYGDADLIGRKIITDTYGGCSAHGGARSAAYICRQMANSIVKRGLSKRMAPRCLLALASALGN